MKSVCVFCGSSNGRPEFLTSARELGRAIAKEKMRLVYGGAQVGLMGTLADAVLEAGGEVTGVLPNFLGGKETAHPRLTELIMCETMHERKMKMFELSEGFIALPGGFGTLEEVSEILTWAQLGLHSHPVAFLNVGGYYGHLRAFFTEMENSKLLKAENNRMALFVESVSELWPAMRAYIPPEIPKWITPRTT